MCRRPKQFPWVLTVLSLTLACGDDTGWFLPPKADAGPRGDTGPSDAIRADTTGATPLQGVVVDDFEDGDSKALYAAGSWYQYDDQVNGGKSAVTGTDGQSIAMNGPGHASARALEVTCAMDQGTLSYPPHIGFGVGLGSAGAPEDLSAFAGIAYTYRGAAHRVRVEAFAVQDYDFAGMNLPASADWQTVGLPFSQLVQEGWGVKLAFNPRDVGNLGFHVRGATGEVVKLDIDDLMLVSVLPDQPPDLQVLPAQVPADVAIDTITIGNPLQAKAMAYLSQGYNLTSWLESGRFAGFA
jgi:endoglucanase